MIRPDQQGKQLEQFLGVATAHRAVFTQRFAGFCQTAPCALQQPFGSLQRQRGIEQTGQRLHPGQALRRVGPGVGQIVGLPTEALEELVGHPAFTPLQNEGRVADPADQAPPGQIGIPARPACRAVAINPLPQPVLRQTARHRIARRGQIVQPFEPVQGEGERIGGLLDIPDRGARSLHQLTVEQEVSRLQLPRPGHRADGAGFGLGRDRRDLAPQRGTPRLNTVVGAARAAAEV